MTDRIEYWLWHKAFKVIVPIDYSLKRGDLVMARNWPYGPVEIIDINWALLAACVRLYPGGGLVVWPVWSLKKVSE